MTEVSCETGVELLMDYLEGVVPDDMRTMLESHVAGCAKCAGFIASYLATPRILREATAATMPPELQQSLLAFLRAHRGDLPGNRRNKRRVRYGRKVKRLRRPLTRLQGRARLPDASSGSRGGPTRAEAAAMRIGRASDERIGLEQVIHGKVGHVLIHRVREAANDPRRVPCRRLEQKCGAIDAIDDPGVLAVDFRRIITDDAADNELGIDANLRQFAPRPEREVLAVAAAECLEAAGMLPNVALMKQFEVRDVLAGLQPRHDVVDGLHPHRTRALEVLSERLP